MKYNNIIKSLFKPLLVLILFISINTFAGKEKYSSAASTKTGATTQLTNSTVLITQDAQYTSWLNALIANPSTPWYGLNTGTISGSFFDKEIKNRVIFSIDHTDNVFTSTAYSVTINFDVYYKKYIAGVFQTFVVSKQLTVNNNQLSITKDKAVYEFIGGNELQVKVTGITISPGTITLANAKVLLETEIDIERYYFFSPNVQYSNNDLKHCSNDLLTKGELEINWASVEGAEEYELEWVHINNYDGTKVSSVFGNTPPGSLTFDEKLFDFNCTRISTGNTYYRIPYIYERGYILYRLRALGRTKATNWEYNVPARWSTEMNLITSPTDVSMFLDKFPGLSGTCNTNEIFLSFNDNLNWQSSISYAEEGKSKAVVNFADGSLRSRQSVTKLKSNNDIIVGETVYDFQGRPVINILPVPSNGLKLEYTPGFNLYSSGNPYNKEYFDYDAGGNCSAITPSLSILNGASKYYSSSNPTLTAENEFIPDAKGFPYTQTEFTPDNTGRIRNQSGVGIDHKLGTDHETKYLYGVPEQKDIDRLFGSEVGEAKRYKKNVVIDGNQQASVTYIDPGGKTIATALAGSTPTNVLSIASSGSVLTTYDLLNKINPTDNSGLSNNLDLTNNKLTLQKSILVPSTGPYSFTYTLVPPKYVENCGATMVIPPNSTITTSGTKCYNCVLDATVSLLNECGQELFTTAFSPTPTASNFTTTGTIDVTCSSGSQPAFTKTITPVDPLTSSPIQLKTGSYIIEKSVKVNKDALDIYTANYLDTLLNPCILKFSDFKNAQDLAIDLSGCGMDCAACISKLGPASNYTTVATCTICLTQEQYDALYQECAELCSTASDKCENALITLEADVSPTGQYGQYSPGGGSSANNNISPPQPNNIQPWLFPLSVINENNILPFKTSVMSTFTAASAGFYPWGQGYKPDWRHPYNPNKTGAARFEYLDEDGNIDQIKVVPDGGGNYVPAVYTWHLSKVSFNTTTNEFEVEPRYLANVADFLDAWETQWAASLVRYHPEYCYYEKCVEDQLSNNYDENLVETDKIVDFNSYLNTVPTPTTSNEFMFPVGIPPLTGTVCSSWTGTIVDPYFLAPSSGSVELCNIRLAMQKYMIDPANPSNYISIWDAAYRIVNCPNGAPGSICTSSPMPTSYIFTSDEEWATFKGMYASLKQSFQDRVNINYAINNTCYNACIGADVFNPFENKFYDPSAFVITYPSWVSSFWSGFPFSWFFWPVSITNTSQFYNGEQTCNHNRHTFYTDKKPRFPTAKMMMPNQLGNASPPCYDENNNIIPCPQADADVINEMGNEADMAAYNNCKQCPTAVNYEQLLKALTTLSTTPSQQDLTNSTIPVQLTCSPSGSLHKEFTIELAQNLFGAGSPTTNVYWQMDPASSGTYLKGTYTYSTTTPCTMHLQMPAQIFPTGIPLVPSTYTPFVNMYTFADATDFCCISWSPTGYTFPVVGFLSGPGRFSGMVTVKTKAGDPLYVSATSPTYRKIVVEGYVSCVDFKNCPFQPICAASKDVKNMQNLLNSLFFGSPAPIYSVSPVVLTNLPYKGFLQPNLIVSLDNAIDASVNNSNDNWFWQHVSSAGQQLTGYLKPNPSGSQCNLTINLLSTSLYSAADIKRLSGLKPALSSSVTPGDFQGYALLRNGSINSGNAVWEKITGNMSCLSAGKCSQETSNTYLLTGGGSESSLGFTTCTFNSALAPQFVEYLDGNLSTLSCSNNFCTFPIAINDPILGAITCSINLTIPEGSTFTFSNVTSVISMSLNPTIIGPGNTFNHFYIVATVTNQAMVGPVNTSTVLISGYTPCTNLGSCPSETCVIGELIVNGDFELGNTGFYSNYTLDAPSSLSRVNFAGLAMPFAPSPHGKFYNVYNIKPVWSCFGTHSDHTTHYLTNPSSPPPFLPCTQSGNGKALVMRSENITLNYTSSPPDDVWYEIVNLKPNTSYTFSAFFKSPFPQSGPMPGMVMQLWVNGVLTGSYGVPRVLNDIWYGSQFIFNSGTNGANTTVALKIFAAAIPGAVPIYNPPFFPPVPTPGTDFNYFLDDISLKGCIDGSVSNSIACDIPVTYIEESEPDCINDAYNVAMEEAEYNYNNYIDGLRKEFQAQYIQKCLDTYEDLFMKCYDSENHFTLYYYDQAGNLVKTVPPEGVNRLPDNSALLSQIMQDRVNNTQTVFTSHTYASTYKFNSLNQLLNQSVPDNEDLNIWQPNNYTGIPSSQNVNGMAFSGNQGVLVSNTGSSGFIYTFNSGSNSWVPVTNLTLNNLNDVISIGTNTFYAIGKNGTVMRTNNNGVSWSFMPFPEASPELIKTHLSTVSSEIVVYDKDGNRWISSSGGNTWTKTVNAIGLAGGEKLVDLKVDVGANNGWAISNFNRIYNYSGTAWTLTSNNVKTISLNDVSGDGSSVIYGVGREGTIVKSNNSGNTWTEIPNELNVDLKSVDFYGAFTGFILTNAGVLHYTPTGGNSFMNFSTLTNALSNIKAFSCVISATELYAIDQTGNFKLNNFSFIGSNWTTLSSLPSTNIYNCVKAVNSSSVYAGGNSAVFFKYNGTSWSAITTTIPSTENIIDIDFKDNGGNVQGYILTHVGKIYRYDAGANTFTQVTGLTPSVVYTSIYCKTSNDAFAASNNGYVAKIIGTTGSETTTGFTNNYKSVFVTTAGNLVAMGENSTDQLGQINSGSTVPLTPVYNNVSQSLIPPTLLSVTTNGTNAFISGVDGTILEYNTTNNTWDTQLTGSNTRLNTISNDIAGNVIAAGKKDIAIPAANQFVYSNNNGVSWTAAAINGFDDFVGSKIIGSNLYVVGANKRIMYTGLTPSTLNNVTNSAGADKFNAVSTDGTGVKFVGDNGLIYGSVILGATALAENNFNPPVLNDVKWYDASHVIAVGNSGQILASDNAGAAWKVVVSGTSFDLKAVDILNPTTAVVVGNNNTYLHVSFTCSGPNCIYTSSVPGSLPSSSGDITDVSAANNNIIVVDDLGAIYYKPSSGGFSAITTTNINPLNSVSLTGSTFGYAVGNTGTLIRLNPSTSAYTIVASPSFIGTNTLTSVYFKDDNIGYVAGTNGVLGKSINGGTTWSSESTPSSITPTHTINTLVPNGNSSIAVGGSPGASGSALDNKNIMSSRFYYDKLGRLIASQNSKQYSKHPLTYSYTKYDNLGRIIEVGEVKGTSDLESLPNTNNGQIDLGSFAAWLNNPGNFSSEITKTYYDSPVNLLPALYDGAGTFVQDNFNLRNRVSYATYQDFATTPYNHATYYNYDIHGNVKSLYQYNAALPAGNKFKRTDYEYDLISGKVNNVKYQDGRSDQMMHHYDYDDDNRITNVFTSKDGGAIWDQDAKYFYYRHGPLARTEIGDNKVQAMDYAYTMHGWIKGVNSNKLVSANDMGNDAETSLTNINRFVSEDAMGYSLGYYNNDYTSIVSGTVNPTGYFLADNAVANTVDANNRDMFNGNISNMTKSIKQFMNTNGGQPQAMLYQYDQLNRLVEAVSFESYSTTNNAWNNTAFNDNYKEFFSYDANGNIKTLKRFDGAGGVMDTLTYQYNTVANGAAKNTNKLGAAQDATVTGTITDDIESGQIFNTSNHALDNYGYDNIGNLIKDEQEEIANIKWTVYGKIKEVIRKNTSTKPDLEFNYDATGNRIGKIVKTKASPGVYNPSNQWSYTYYSRDAQGNVLATYEQTQSNGNTLHLQEQHLYGSNRVGVLTRSVNVQSPPSYGGVYEREAGNKAFELSNHLGNVLTVVTDRKLPVDANSDNVTDYNTPDIISATDYYSFGSPMPGRQTTGSQYRYGFNGKENDKEVTSTGQGTQDYGMRIYNPSLGRFLSVDPISKEYPWYSPYHFAGNRPIQAIDLDGLEPKDLMTGKTIIFPSQAQLKTLKSNDYSLWKDMLKWEQSCKYRSVFNEADKGRILERQEMDWAFSDILNTDYYAVKITQLPKGMTENQLFEKIRVNLATYLGDQRFGPNWDFTSEELWKSKNPTGAIMVFKDYRDNAPVLVSQASENHWVFTPVGTFLDDEHMLAGHREFGLTKNADGSYTFYTRGVDSMWDSFDLWVGHYMADFFGIADKLWNTVMDNVVKDVNATGGKAEKTHNFTRKIDWEKDVQDCDKGDEKCED